jgi:hypothetical protein
MLGKIIYWGHWKHMRYDYFIGMVKHHETKHIRAYTGEQQTNPEHVPTAFALLMPEIISILNENFDDVCGLGHGIVIFGLQPASAMIASNIPLEQERFVDGLQPDYHFCCTLDFFKVPMSDINDSEDWNYTDSIVVDFTSGELMDSDRFLSKLHFLPEQGKLYGRINKEALNIAWTITRIKQAKSKGKSLLFNHMIMEPHIAEVA